MALALLLQRGPALRENWAAEQRWLKALGSAVVQSGGEGRERRRLPAVEAERDDEAVRLHSERAVLED